ncbi:MAG: UvrD-helicase domain-containing protein [Patescibacteria group bacterium]
MINIETLNKEQKKAVLHENGPLLIVAGAGTGKTTVITQRIACLIEKGLAKPEEILAVTFTDKAAGEMEERVDRLLPFGYTDLWISTFHSFCERVLKDHALDIGLPNDFQLLDQTGAWLLIRQNLDKFDFNYYKSLGNPTKFIHTLIDHFSRCKDQSIYPNDYLEYAESLKTNLTDLPETQEIERIKEVANAFHVYQKLLLDNDSLDFGDLINYCLQLFQKRPGILKKYQDKFKYILVDEFQDTNYAQYELIKILSEPENNLTVCADDDQAIYMFRGASYNNIIQFKKDFPQSKEVFLLTNYRSSQNILDISYNLIQNNNPDRLEHVSQIDKKLIASDSEKGIVEHLHFTTHNQENRGVVDKIKELLKKDKEASFSDFAILSRTNAVANVFAKALERAGLPYQFLASRGLYSKPVVLDIISYFKILDNYHESSAVFRVLNLDFLNISSSDIVEITQYARKKTQGIFESLKELPMISGLSENAVNQINFILSLIEKHSFQIKERSVSEILISFLNDSGYLKYISNNEDKYSLDLINQFFKKVKEFEELSIDSGLKNFMEQLELELESGEQGRLEFDPEQGPDMIKIMTVHGAKGLEFKYVFVVNLVDKRFPTIEHRNPIEVPIELIKEIIPKGDVHLQEERRLFYVGLTRAKRGLFFTSADDYGGMRKKKLSRFLTEMGFEKEIKEESPEELIEQKKEKRIIKEKIILPKHFSFSQLVAFANCPYQYKLAHVLRVPVGGRASFSFGKTIHNTLYEFVKEINENKGKQKDLFNKKTKNNKKSLSLNDLLLIYEKEWIDDWYENSAQKQEYKKLGKDILRNFYNDFEKNPPEILKTSEGLGLELPFKLKIGNVTIKGVIDRVDEVNGEVEIIDYKTGQHKEKLSPQDKQQLLLYQIATEEIFGLKPFKLTYYYLEQGQKVSFLGNAKDKEKEKENILKKIEEIKNSDFVATPGWQCNFCDFKYICNFAKLNN